jgi:hypothetical protein
MLFPYAPLFFPDPSSFLSWISQLVRCKAAEVSGWADFRPDVSYKLQICATVEEYKSYAGACQTEKTDDQVQLRSTKRITAAHFRRAAALMLFFPLEIRILTGCRLHLPFIKPFHVCCGSQLSEGSYALSFTQSHQER